MTRAAVVGGSLGGLTAGLVLRDQGWDVEVVERSPIPLETMERSSANDPAHIGSRRTSSCTEGCWTPSAPSTTTCRLSLRALMIGATTSFCR